LDSREAALAAAGAGGAQGAPPSPAERNQMGQPVAPQRALSGPTGNNVLPSPGPSGGPVRTQTITGSAAATPEGEFSET